MESFKICEAISNITSIKCTCWFNKWSIILYMWDCFTFLSDAFYFFREELRRWFMQQELDLFRFRFLREGPDSRDEFLRENSLNYEPVCILLFLCYPSKVSTFTSSFFLQNHCSLWDFDKITGSVFDLCSYQPNIIALLPNKQK